jgi:hypothetical protein
VDAAERAAEPQPERLSRHVHVGWPAVEVHAELGPALLAAGLDAKILAYDHNWSMHPDDIGSTPPGETPETEYPSLVLADARAAPWVDGIAYHCSWWVTISRTSAA